MTQDQAVTEFMESHGFIWNGESWQYKERFKIPVIHPQQALFFYTICQKVKQEAYEQGKQDAVVTIMSAKTEGLFDNGDLFIKRRPIEDAIVELLGYEGFKAIQESLPPPVFPPQDTTNHTEDK